MLADRNFRLQFFIPPDKSFLLAYWPNDQKSLPERLGVSLTLSAVLECRYQIRTAPGKGVGMFAMEDIAPGAIVARERPILVAPLMLSWDSIERDISSNMPEHVREAFFALHNCKPPSFARVHGIINTNAINIDDMPGQTDFGPYVAVLKDICRANHSCNPNAIYRWDFATFTGALHARRAIAAGEEVSISYIGAHMPYAERHERLRDKYFFVCKCPVCNLPPAARAEDDRARQELTFVRGLLEAGFYDEFAPDVPKQLAMAKMLEDASDCNVSTWRAVAGKLVRAYCTLGERAEAVKWARRAMEMTLVDTGTDGGWAAVVAAPENTDVWRSKVVDK
ncbi:SET domain-containing protein [Auriscalpium vulgare]|uniref:SET domain-containing protein n=1 Tax=Auriscalpium vulgare TaxID=40419 RepID=A0ACB8S2Q2_9AGAM|nr:SET domain-containing protein [Auriscalpium vulgare]